MLKRALKAKKITFNERNGQITTTIRGRQITVTKDRIESSGSRYDRVSTEELSAAANELRVMAAVQSVDESAEANGFTVEWSLSEIGQPECVLEREVF